MITTTGGINLVDSTQKDSTLLKRNRNRLIPYDAGSPNNRASPTALKEMIKEFLYARAKSARARTYLKLFRVGLNISFGGISKKSSWVFRDVAIIQ